MNSLVLIINKAITLYTNTERKQDSIAIKGENKYKNPLKCSKNTQQAYINHVSKTTHEGL